VHIDPDSRLVAAARAGDQNALDELVAAYLPLVYNIVGRALDGHADVDDVVQETMLRVVHGLSGLRDPAAFRSWLVAITIHQVRDRQRGRRPVPLDEAYEAADPGADFVDLTIVRLGLSGQRRQVAEATRWLDRADRELLALWWLEAAGELTRAELAQALELTPQHAAVRIQRMKAQLETARAVVRALWSMPRCAELAAMTRGWDGHPDSLWRKRLARHSRDCADCERHWHDLVPAERLLVGLALVPMATGSSLLSLASAANAPTITLQAVPAHPVAAHSAGTHPPLRPRPRLRTHPRGAGHVLRAIATKPAVIAAVAVIGVSGGAIALTGKPSSTPPVAISTPHTSAALSLTPSPSPSASPSPSPSASPSATPSRSVSHSTSPTPKSTAPVYGQTVDQVDTVPAVTTFPGTLPKRTDGTVSVTGKYEAPFVGSLGGKYLMFYNRDYTTITGTGYIQIRWEVAFFNRSPGQIRMPTWTGLTGRLFHVASGGGRRMDDEVPGQTDKPHTWMGRPAVGYDTVPAGAQQMWQNEYYYLDGTVTLHENEDYTDYNLSVTPVMWADVTANIDTAPNPSKGIVRYGIVRDTGTDAAPVPQYLTRSTPADPTTVAQRSIV